jgi:hypothetical protein
MDQHGCRNFAEAPYAGVGSMVECGLPEPETTENTAGDPDSRQCSCYGLLNSDRHWEQPVATLGGLKGYLVKRCCLTLHNKWYGMPAFHVSTTETQASRRYSHTMASSALIAMEPEITRSNAAKGSTHDPDNE